MQTEQDLESGRVTLHLLDSSLGHPIQSWTFDNRDQIKIGRATDNDITIPDSRVSRFHVELVHASGKWVLRSHGRNGTCVEGKQVSEMRVRDKTIFQLGPDGPSFRFATVREENSIMATIENVDPETFDFLEIDEDQTEQEVRQIVESDAFRALQERARQLRTGNERTDC